MQEAQFTTLGGNVTAVAVKGTFDDCQRLAKEAFADAAAAVARAADVGEFNQPRPAAAADVLLRVRGVAVQGADAAGDFGAIGQLRQPRRRRDGVEDGRADQLLLRADDDQRHGAALLRVRPRRAAAVGARRSANAMDVGNPSNLERLQWLFDGDLAAMRKVISTAPHTDDEVRGAIAELYKKYSYVADPHSAIGYLGATAARRRPARLARFSSPPRIPRNSVKWWSRSSVNRCRCLMRLPKRLHARKRSQRIGPTLASVIEVAMIDACPRQRAPAPSTLVPARESLDPKYTWDLSSIFSELGRVGSGLRRARPRHRSLQEI